MDRAAAYLARAAEEAIRVVPPGTISRAIRPGVMVVAVHGEHLVRALSEALDRLERDARVSR